MKTNQNQKDLIKDFENSLEKPHNYLRIANQYLQYLIENNIELSIESKTDFLECKAPVYKTALNKFFKNCIIESEMPFCVFELVEEKEYADIDNSIFDGLAESSKETYYNIISEYKSIYKESLCSNEFESYIETLKNRVSKTTVRLHYSCIKRVFDFYKAPVWFVPYKIDKQKKSKTYLMTDKKKGIFKIGKSKNPKIREQTLQYEKPTIKLLAICEQLVEKTIHKEYEMYRIRGEWFKLSNQQIQDIVIKYNFKFI